MGRSKPLDVGRRRYRPPSWCEAHHLDEWFRDDGPTDLVNLALLCSRHHHDVHECGRILEQDEQGQWQIKLGLPPPRAPAA